MRHNDLMARRQMTWSQLPPDIREIAERELTPRQLRVFELRMTGHSWRTIGDSLGIHEATARGHFRASLIALRPHIRKDAA